MCFHIGLACYRMRYFLTEPVVFAFKKDGEDGVRSILYEPTALTTCKKCGVGAHGRVPLPYRGYGIVGAYGRTPLHSRCRPPPFTGELPHGRERAFRKPPYRRERGELKDCLGPNSPLPCEGRGVGGARSKKPTLVRGGGGRRER
jgi:hypothetical protein